mmetsp:Transcript_125028/g.266860  ORF Transcript_125028/g.266860 Transcript_125028/m.266860 type:complete len:146 (-) Transcript_125028:84-521(-)
MPSGKMLRWNSDKGFGFIQPNDGGEDLFCHVSALLDGEGSVAEGDAVDFKEEFDDRKGKNRAVKVSVSGGGGGRGGGGRGRDRSRSPPRRGGGGGGGYDRRDRDDRSPPPRRGGGGGGGYDRRDRDDRSPPPRRDRDDDRYDRRR